MAIRVAEVTLGLSEKRSAASKFGSDERFATARVVLEVGDEPDAAYQAAAESVRKGIEKAWALATKEERAAKKGGWHLASKDRDAIQKLTQELEALSGEPVELTPPKSQEEVKATLEQLRGAVFDYKKRRKE